MGIGYALTLTQALLQVLASYSMQLFFSTPTFYFYSHFVFYGLLYSHSCENYIGIPVFPV